MRRIETTPLPVPIGGLPVTIAEAKAQARYEDTDEDAYIESLIAAASKTASQYTGKPYYDRAFEIWWDCSELVDPRYTLKGITVERHAPFTLGTFESINKAGAVTALPADAYYQAENMLEGRRTGRRADRN
jgi:hypothetical protein